MKRKPIPPPRNTNPLIVRLVELMNESELHSSFDLCNLAGISTGLIHAWRNESNPNISNLEAVLNALGYELTIQRRAGV